MGSDADKVAQAESFKEEANTLFKNQKFEDAVELYSKAIDLNPSNPVYYGNRSFAHLKLEFYGSALEDATKAISLDNSYIKGFYRKAAAHFAMGKFKLALKDFEAVHKVRPNDPDAKRKFQECTKIVRKINFEKAIAVDDPKKSVVDDIDIESMSIEDDYSGPALDENGSVTLDFMKQLLETYRDQGKLHRRYAYKILMDIRKLFQSQPTMVEITVPKDQKFTICGDVHGQYYDLLNIFEINGLPSPDNPYLFNGDFVDRGSFSVETIFTLFGFKLLYPEHFFMSRGNHESEVMNQMYGFEGEVKAKYTAQMASLFTEIYNWLPLCHLINNKILVMHGGLFKEDGVTLKDIRETKRDRQPPEEGIMCDLLWSDPCPLYGRTPSKRGVGIQFGPDVTDAFLKANGLDYIVRSHEVKPEGYEENHNGKCITVFSAPNYCDTMGNKGAFITITGSDLTPKFTSFDSVPHPKVRPMAYANSLFGVL